LNIDDSRVIFRILTENIFEYLSGFFRSI